MDIKGNYLKKRNFYFNQFSFYSYRAKVFRAERTEVFLLCPQQSKQNAWLACSVAIRCRHARPQKEPLQHTTKPFVSSFAT